MSDHFGFAALSIMQKSSCFEPTKREYHTLTYLALGPL
jgi:hypothetical protein